MPPRSLFFGRLRPRGMEFPACDECNNKTRGADTAASFFARVRTTSGDSLFWSSPEGKRLIHSVDKDAPGLRNELFGRRGGRIWLPERSGILARFSEYEVNGPIVASHLDVFSAKLGMALFNEHVGIPLPLDGAVQTQWFPNRGLSDRTVRALISIMPVGGTLKQGKFEVPEQFAYRYNCDGKSILAALVGLHGNFHVLVVATADPDAFGLPHDLALGNVGSNFLRPGELVGTLNSGQSTQRQLLTADRL